MGMFDTLRQDVICTKPNDEENFEIITKAFKNDLHSIIINYKNKLINLKNKKLMYNKFNKELLLHGDIIILRNSDICIYYTDNVFNIMQNITYNLNTFDNELLNKIDKEHDIIKIYRLFRVPSFFVKDYKNEFIEKINEYIKDTNMSICIYSRQKEISKEDAEKLLNELTNDNYIIKDNKLSEDKDNKNIDNSISNTKLIQSNSLKSELKNGDIVVINCKDYLYRNVVEFGCYYNKTIYLTTGEQYKIDKWSKDLTNKNDDKLTIMQIYRKDNFNSSNINSMIKSLLKYTKKESKLNKIKKNYNCIYNRNKKYETSFFDNVNNLKEE